MDKILQNDLICRICLSKSDPLCSIFGTLQDIPNILMNFANVEIFQSDGLPEHICTTCIFEATRACSFKTKCEESDKILRQSLYNLNGSVKTEATHQMNVEVEEIDQQLLDECSIGPDNGVFFQEQTLIYLQDKESTPNKSKRTAASDNNGTPPSKVLQCDKCEENFAKRIDLKRHLTVDHTDVEGERSFSCIECHKSYGSDYLLTTHMKTHNDRIYNCDDCDRKFQRLDILVDHRKRHTNERTQLCPTCGKAFVDLERHTRTHTKEPAMHQCIICGKIMSHSNNLLIHMRAHKNRTSPLIAESNGTKTILCSVCGRSCSSRSNLAVHMRRHSGEMTNFCLVCGKGYPRSTDLKIHMRKHTGEKPFGCQVCLRRFARSDKLAIHMRIHTGEKPYVCLHCGRAYAQSNDLASHKRRNTCSASQRQTLEPSAQLLQNVNNSKHGYATKSIDLPAPTYLTSAVSV